MRASFMAALCKTAGVGARKELFMTTDAYTLKEKITFAAQLIRTRLDGRAPEVGIVLGSGLGPLAEQI